MISNRILAFESSCDETAVAVYEAHTQKLFHRLHSQSALHAQYGGVVPELASRDHIRYIRPLAQEVLGEAGCTWQDIDLVAYTAGPGLVGALMVAAAFAESLALALTLPVLPVHHLEGHILSPLLAEPAPPFPYIALLVSGGHSQLYQVEAPGHYRLLGESIDDAAGEAFDKSAKLLGLPYPGGHHLEALALKASSTNAVRQLPRPMLHSPNLQMSFSGLKTAVWHWLRRVSPQEGSTCYPQIAAEFQSAVIDVLLHKTMKACTQTGIDHIAICGGVACNQSLRNAFASACADTHRKLFMTPVEYCTDNAAMIAFVAAAHSDKARPAGAFTVNPHWSLAEV